MAFTLKRAEAIVAALLTIEAIWLRYVAATAGGALWRDEANTVALVTLPSLSDVWKNLQFDSFPILWLFVVRGFSAVVGPMNDQAFRVLGFVVGLAIVGVLWFYARTFRQSYPVISLALFAISPSVIVWGDSVRGYGFGVVLILLTGALLWRFIQQPNALTFSAAAVFAVASVHTLYYNSVLLFAYCAAGVAVCVQTRAWKKAAMVVSIGALSALSIVPYASTIRQAKNWNGVVRIPHYPVSLFFEKIDDTMSSAGPWAFYLWLALFGISILAAVRLLWFHTRLDSSDDKRQTILFSLVSLIVGSVGIFLFLKTLSYPTEYWYYLTILALAAVCIDTILSIQTRAPSLRIARMVLVLSVGVGTFIPAMIAARTRLTNVDILASKLEAAVSVGDIVLVNPWQTGVSFNRYYRAGAPWMTVPPINFHRFHRYDLIKRATMADQVAVMRPVIDAMTKALQGGHRVFIVGNLQPTRAGERPAVLPPAPAANAPYPEGAYSEEWTHMAGDFLQQHARVISEIPVHAPARVNELEHLRLGVAEGWR